MKTNLTAITVAALCCLTPAAHADIFTFTGDTTGGPTFNRLLVDLSALSSVGTNVAYDVFTFSVDTSGQYTFVTTAAFDSFSFLYGPAFTPTAPLTNALAGNDDLIAGSTTVSGFGYALDAGVTYSYVGTAFYNGDAGAFTTTIGGPGTITAAVPEPGTWALMALGLAGVGFYNQRRRQQG